MKYKREREREREREKGKHLSSEGGDRCFLNELNAFVVQGACTGVDNGGDDLFYFSASVGVSRFRGLECTP